MDAVFANVTEEEKDALLYTAIFNETIRLKETAGRKERERIRTFILDGYRALTRPDRTRRQNQDNVRENMPQPCPVSISAD